MTLTRKTPQRVYHRHFWQQTQPTITIQYLQHRWPLDSGDLWWTTQSMIIVMKRTQMLLKIYTGFTVAKWQIIFDSFPDRIFSSH
jgi:hypothetical protein